MSTHLSDEARGWIGHRFAPATFILTPAEVRRFEVGTALDPATPLTAEAPDGPAPIGIHLAIGSAAQSLVPRAQLHEDGVPVEDGPELLAGRRLPPQEQIEFVEDLRHGDTLTIERWISEVRERETDDGTLIEVVYKREFRDQEGTVKIRQISTLGRVIA